MTVSGAVNIGLNEELGLKKWKWTIVRPTDLRLNPLYTKVFQIYKNIIIHIFLIDILRCVNLFEPASVHLYHPHQHLHLQTYKEKFCKSSNNEREKRKRSVCRNNSCSDSCGLCQLSLYFYSHQHI